MSEQINYVNKPIMDENVQITKQKLALKQPKQLETPLTVLGQTETEVEGALDAINNKERALTYAEYEALTETEKQNGTTYYITDLVSGGDSMQVVAGYYNPSDGQFYEESTYITLINGEVGCVYIDLSTNRFWVYDSPSQSYIDTLSHYVLQSSVTPTPTSGSNAPFSSGGAYTELNNKADKSTTLNGYGITNAYTKDEINELFAEYENNISWKPAVATYADIATTYPNPQEGWTVVTTDTNIAWRYSGGQWVEISANTIPIATASVDGLMSKDMFSKLNGIQAGAEVNVQSDWNQTTTTADDYIKNKPVDATTSTSGFMSASDKSKLNGIATGAEVNQNAFSNILVDSTTIAADSKTDTLTLAAGSNITLTPDATNDKVTITATDSTYPNAITNITRNGTTFTATRYNGSTFTFTQQDNNTTTGTTYTAGSCPNNTTFGTNGSIANAFAWLNSNKVSKYAYKYLGDNYVMTASTFDSGMNLYSCGSLSKVTNNGYKNWIPHPNDPNVDTGDYWMLSLYGGNNTFMIVLCISPRLPQYIHIGAFWDGKFNGWYRHSGAVIT